MFGVTALRFGPSAVGMVGVQSCVPILVPVLLTMMTFGRLVSMQFCFRTIFPPFRPDMRMPTDVWAAFNALVTRLDDSRGL